jgi:hypothetical protein
MKTPRRKAEGEARPSGNVLPECTTGGREGSGKACCLSGVSAHSDHAKHQGTGEAARLARSSVQTTPQCRQLLTSSVQKDRSRSLSRASPLQLRARELLVWRFSPGTGRRPGHALLLLALCCSRRCSAGRCASTTPFLLDLARQPLFAASGEVVHLVDSIGVLA